MSVYILNLFSILFYFILFRYAVKAIKSRKQYLCLIVALQLFLTAALRNTVVGGDLANYIPAFKEIGNLSWDELVGYFRTFFYQNTKHKHT